MSNSEQVLEQAVSAADWRSAAFWVGLVKPALLVAFVLGLAAIDIATDHTGAVSFPPSAPAEAAKSALLPGAATEQNLPALAPPRPTGPLSALWGDFGPSSFPGYNGGPPAGTPAPTTAGGTTPTTTDTSTSTSAPPPGANLPAALISGSASPMQTTPASAPTSAMAAAMASGAGILSTLQPLMPWPGYTESTTPLAAAEASLQPVSAANPGTTGTSGTSAPSQGSTATGHRTGGSGHAASSHAAPAPAPATNAPATLTHHIGRASLTLARRR